MRLTVLGCSGTFPAADTGCSAYLLEHDGFRILLDMGSGAVSQLQQHGGIFDLDAIFVSHLHADHCLDIVGYTYARRYAPGGMPPQLPIYGPPGTMARITAAGGWPAADGLEECYTMQELAPGRVDIGPFSVDLAVMNHPAYCLGSRWSAAGRSLTYSGDTASSDELIRLAKGTDLALFEASWYDEDPNPPGVHLTAGECGDHASRAGTDRLLLTHIVPWGDRQRTYEQARKHFVGDLDVATRGVVYDI